MPGTSMKTIRRTTDGSVGSFGKVEAGGAVLTAERLGDILHVLGENGLSFSVDQERKTLLLQMPVVDGHITNIRFKIVAPQALPPSAPIGEPYVTTAGKFYIGQGEEKPLLLLLGGETGIQNILQVVKLGVEADESNPKVIDITIPKRNNYKSIPLEVLRRFPGAQDVIPFRVDFDNSDASDFLINDDVLFENGVMKLRENYTISVSPEQTEKGTIYRIPLQAGRWKKIEGIEVE
jgi:hypothetical protein